MKYDLKDTIQADLAFGYLQTLVEQESEVEVKKLIRNRSLNQNSYLHLTFGIFGLETGFEASEAKTIYKRQANPELYIYKKNNQTFLRSSADLNTKEMSDSIDKWIKYAGENGVEIPTPNQEEAIRYWSNEIESKGKWL